MKQFYCTDLRPTPYGMEEIQRRFPQSAEVVSRLGIGQHATDTNGDTWFRGPDLVLQDDVPMTAADVAECRTSASRVRQSLRLERIATAALPWALSTRNPGSGWDEVAATLAVAAAKALIAELDKQA